MIVTAHYDTIRREYTYRCPTCGTTLVTITDEQIARADNVMDLMPTEPPACDTCSTPPSKGPDT